MWNRMLLLYMLTREVVHNTNCMVYIMTLNLAHPCFVFLNAAFNILKELRRSKDKYLLRN